MADDLNTEIKIGADASGVEAGVSKAKRSLKDLGDSAARAGKDAGAGIGAIGAGGDKAAKDVERATKNIQGQLQRAIASFEAGEKGSRKFYESLASQRGADVSTLKPLLDQLDAYKGKADAAAQASVKASTSFTGLGAAAGLAARAVAAIGIGVSVGEFVRMADASTNVASRLGLVTASAAELASVQQRLFGIAQASRVSFVDLVGTYAQVARSTKELGVSQSALLGVIQTISQAVTISGGSAESTQAALIQLSQGFASGALRGQELNSVMEQTPRLAQAIAEGLGVSIGKLREMGAAGELTAEKVLGALEKSATAVQSEFGKMAVTVEQASTNAANSVLKLVGAFDRLFGITSVLGGSIQAISKGLDFLSRDVEKMGSQGALRDAAQEVLRLDGYARNLRDGMKNGVFNPNAEAQLARINAQLAVAKARFRELDQQIGGVKDPRDQTGFASRGSSYANEAKRLAKLAEDANTFRLNQSGVPASYLKDMAELIRLNQAGVLVGKEYTEALKAQQDMLLKKTGAVKGSAAAVNAEQNAYASLVSSISQKIEAEKLELSGGDKLNDAQKLRIKFHDDLKGALKGLGASQQAYVESLLAQLDAAERAGEAEKKRIKTMQAGYAEYLALQDELNAAYVADSKARDAGRQAVTDYVRAIDEQNAQTQLELTLVGKSEAARRTAIAQFKVELDLKKKIAEIDANTGFDEPQRIEQRAKARAAAATAYANVETQATLDVMNATVQQYDDIFRQGFADMLNRGEDGIKAFGKSLKTTVMTSVADAIYRALAQRFVVNIVGNVLGMGGAAAGAMGGGGGSSALGMASNASSLYSAVSGNGIIGNAASTVGGWLGFGGAAASGLGLSAAAGAGTTLAAAGSGLGLAGSAAGAGYGLTAAGTGLGLSAGSAGAGAIGAGLGTSAAAGGTAAAGAGAGITGALAAIPVWGWALAAVAALAAMWDDGSGTLHTGAKAQYSGAGGLATTGEGASGEYGLKVGMVYDKNTADFVSGIARGLTETFDGMAVAFGQKAGFEIATAFADDTSKDGAWGALRISREGKDLLNWENTRTSKWAPKEFSDGEAGQKEYLAAIAKDTRQVLLDMDLPSWADTLLNSIGEAASMEQLSQAVMQIGQIQTMFVQLGQTVDGFAGMGDKAFEALMKASGGLEALAQNAGAYYENFYTEAERMETATRQLTAELAKSGVAMPASKDAYRALVEEQLNAGEAGQALAAKLLQLNGAFAQVADYAEQAAQAQADAMESLEIKLLRAQGNEVAAVAIERQKELAALQAFGPAAVAMQQQIHGIVDAMSAMKSGAAAYFTRVDKQQAAQGYTAQGDAALDKFFGSVAAAAGSAAVSAAQASADAAKAAAASWRSAAQSIQSAIDGIRGGTTDAMDPAARYTLTKVTLDALTLSALGGDADAASKLAGAADDFLRASESGSTTQAQYLRDRVLAEAKLASVMESSEAQASVQDAIASSASAAVDQLTAMNANLTGFSAQVYELLSKSYQGADRATAGAAAAGLAAMQANFESYFRDTSAGQVGELAGGMGQLTRLDGGVGAYTNAAGDMSYFRSSESALDIAKRIPEFRDIWEKEFGLKLPAFAVGTNYVPRDMTARIHEGEAIVPKAFNPWAGGAGGQQDNGEMLAELRALRQTNERLEARLASIEESNRDMANLLDNVTEGGNAMRSEVMA